MPHEGDIQTFIRLVKRQVRDLHVPFIDGLTAKKRDPFKILVSTILSLRTQDATTAQASMRLFALADTAEDMCALEERAIENAIYPVGFYRAKAKTIRELSKKFVDEYDSRVPDTLEELLKLKGVGRKTANLVLTLGYNKYGICVDTHVHRIANRWGYVKTRTPNETEFALREKLPKRYWKEINGLLVGFGQNVCKPVSPLCSRCLLSAMCKKVNVTGHR